MEAAAKKTNLAKGKKIRTTLDFAKHFSTLSLDHKLTVSKNIQKALDTGISTRGAKMNDTERKAVEQLSRWCGVNILIGNELCPPDALNTY